MNKENIINFKVVIIMFIIILILIIISIVFCVNTDISKKANNTSHIVSTNKITSFKINNDKESLAFNTIDQYLEELKKDNIIGDYKILSIKVLEKNEMCPGTIYDDEKIYVSFNIEYKQIDENYVISDNDNNDNNEDKTVFSTTGNYVVSNNNGIYEIENMYSAC